ncbi:MAG: GNAT family N-acetyltransferase [Promethearchaeota archaeon]
MSIHRADFKDIKTIQSVINKSNSEAYREIMPPEYFKEPVLTLDELQKDFRHMIFYIYEIEEKIVGVAALKVWDDEVGQIRWVYILPEYQKKRIGTALIIYIEKEAIKTNLKELRVLTNENAYWARNFYVKLGYKLTDRVPRPWGDDIIYKKEL